MKQINLDDLKRKYASINMVDQETCDLANRLLLEHCISDGFQIAAFLGLPYSMGNHKAVRVWVSRNMHFLDDNETSEERYCQLRKLFQKNLMDYSY